jgi:hypothetical protein
MTRRRNADRVRRRRLGGRDDGDDSEEATEDVSEADDGTGSEPTISEAEIPYILRRDSVNSGRVQKSVFIRPYILDAETEFIETLEDELGGEEVYTSDAREAALLYGLRHPGEVASILREWGYDLD